MSDILVTKDNLGRFAKRLQKALSATGQKTTLAEATELLQNLSAQQAVMNSSKFKQRWQCVVRDGCMCTD